MGFLINALRLAETRRGFCSPNPSVGAVVVKDGRIIGQGCHFASGSPHAEVEALSACSEDPAGSTIYVTLEPCCHWGKTPPCTSLLIEKKVGKVVYGFPDPNPVVEGKGAEALQHAGIPCERENNPEVNRFYESYAYWTTTHTFCDV